MIALVELGVLDAPLVVVLDDFLERTQAAVVHVGAGVLDLAERGGLEGALFFFAVSDEVAPQVGVGPVHADADVLVRAVGEVEAEVAAIAGGLLEEDILAPSAARG